MLDVTLASGEQVVSGGALVPGAPVSVATIDFSARGGDEYPFGGAPFQSIGLSYQHALAQYLTTPVAQGGLGGQVTAARYPEIPAGADGARIVRID